MGNYGYKLLNRKVTIKIHTYRTMFFKRVMVYKQFKSRDGQHFMEGRCTFELSVVYRTVCTNKIVIGR